MTFHFCRQMAGKMNMCSTSETKGADNKKSDVKDKPQYAQGDKV